jgi:molybdopterin synthase catalytic subunit/molybdopterin converting factor small subunit
MRIAARTFAALRETSASRLELELPDAATVEDAWDRFVSRYPAAARYRPVVRVARNGAYAAWESALAEGDEVAFLPPVSGGAEAPTEVAGAPLTEGPIDVGALEAIATLGDGARVTFVGRARDRSDDGREVVELEYEAYPEMARRVLGQIVAEAGERWPSTRAAVAHRTGIVPLGEVTVAIVTASPHRAEAYEANRWLIEAIKDRLPIWKRERYRDGNAWKRGGA